MKSKEVNRVVRVFQNGAWVVKPFDELQKGDKFQIFDDGVQYIDSFGRIEWTVRKSAQVGKQDLLYVEVEEETL
ncbi:hypothetical protein [Paenibacillus xylanexedens]|uniref:hypothetical protein n=1 Tax=Paenibacillus xylanexedens TaxID=528191 RepID=UPI000F52E067|nr:hypothetical protein [Paenibacillus xylanexedens]RPK20019.1 hypothetical protein EDO6_06536 [Paenibacillus xylanexedens]